MGGRRWLAATVLTLVGLLLLGVPTVMLGNSFATTCRKSRVAAQDGKLRIPAPSPSVAGWPIVGKKIDAAWDSAATNLPAFVSQNQEQLKDLSRKALRQPPARRSPSCCSSARWSSPRSCWLRAESGQPRDAAHLQPADRPGARSRIQKLADRDRCARSQPASSASPSSQALLLGMGFMFAGHPGGGRARPCS